MQIKGEITSVFRCVPICPAMSHFVHQPPILQHHKSPLLCTGVTNRRVDNITLKSDKTANEILNELF